MGLGDLGAFAVAIQAKVQMRLRCSGKGQHLQEGRGQLLLCLTPQACPSTRAHVLPLLVMGIQCEECFSLPGCPEDKVLSLCRSGFQDPTGYIRGRGGGALSLNRVVRVGISSPGLIELKPGEGWGISWYLHTEPQALG